MPCPLVRETPKLSFGSERVVEDVEKTIWRGPARHASSKKNIEIRVQVTDR